MDVELQPEEGLIMPDQSAQITVEALINAPIQRVWECWTGPAHIVNWNFASDDWRCPHAENDPRPGGKLNWRMEAKDGSFGFDFEGIYDEVIQHSTIKYHIIDGRKVILTFSEENGKTRVTETFDPEDINSRELQQQGWQLILNNFKKYSESI